MKLRGVKDIISSLAESFSFHALSLSVESGLDLRGGGGSI